MFVFHGHGGTARGAIRSFAMQREWPEAISVYMQGLNTPGRLSDPDGKSPGWQLRAGDQKTDPIMKFERQLRTMEAVRALNGCDTDGKPWEKSCTIYPSRTGTPFVAFIHPGDHGFPAEAPALIARFFKEHDAPKP